MEFLTAIIGIITLIVFLVMASNIGAMKKKVDNIEKYIHGFAKEYGYGITYKCSDCKKAFEGKQEKCPHCGEENEYS
ncbi:MAG: hypothetical protein HOA61_13080 [Bacteroidetes bacterium]|jgi:rubrerythrin|nr:hypothetical protein [Bacteroidota bacterium]MBT7996026.1 hypothetical protein [Bacteroidota bacterium]